MRAAAIVGMLVMAVPAAARADVALVPNEAPPPAIRYETQPHSLQADLGLSVIGLAYEQPFSEHSFAQVEVDITSTYFAPWFDDGKRVDGYAGGLRYSWFPRSGARGLYVAPYVRVARLTSNDVSGVGYGVSGGAFVGWAWRVTDRIDIRAGVGVQYYDYRVHGDGLDSPFFALDGVVGYRLY